MVQLSMQTALQAGCFDQVILSSEDSEIIEIAKLNSEITTSQRPPDLARDDVRADDVIRWEINRLSLNSTDTVCCLLPTTPLLTSEVLLQAHNQFKNHPVLFGVVKTSETPFRSFRFDPQTGVLDSLFPEMLQKQSHEYPNTVVDAGQFYFAQASTWEENYSITAAKGSTGFLLDSELAVDINYPEDWERLRSTNSIP